MTEKDICPGIDIMKSIRSDLAGQLLKLVEKRMKTHPDQIIENKVSPGKVMIAQDGAPKELFFILQGTVKIFYTTLKGSEYLMAVAGPGELVGEVEILTNESHICSIKAITDSRLGVVKKTDYLDWLREDHNFSLLVNKAICFRLQKISARAAMHLIYPLEYSVLKYIKDAVHASPVKTLLYSILLTTYQFFPSSELSMTFSGYLLSQNQNACWVPCPPDRYRLSIFQRKICGFF